MTQQQKHPTHSWYNHINDNNNQNTSVSNVTNKWVVNLSSTPHTEAQTSLLAGVPKCAIVSRHPPKGDYVSAVEEECKLLPSKVAAELRADTSKHLDRTHTQTQHHHTRSQSY